MRMVCVWKGQKVFSGVFCETIKVEKVETKINIMS